MPRLFLTERALGDLEEIARFSVERWGAVVAARYLEDIEDALQRLRESPDLLGKRDRSGGRLQFYPVRQHVLVCDLLRGDVYVLTVWHGAMDLVARLRQLEPLLADEAEQMAQRIEAAE